MPRNAAERPAPASQSGAGPQPGASVTAPLLAAAALTLLSLASAGCAQLGPVLPPSAWLPRPVTDFQAARVGDRVQMRWTTPTHTSDGVAWKASKGKVAFNLCLWPGIVTGAPQPPAAVIPPTAAPQIASPPPSGFGAALNPSGRVMPRCPELLRLNPAPVQRPSTELTAAIPISGLGAAGFVTLALYAVNSKNEGAGWSNLAVVPLTPVAPPPQLLSATPTANGVELRWSSPPPSPQSLVVYRDGAPLAASTPGATRYLDHSVVWNRHYLYNVRVAAGTGSARVQSAPSNTLQVTPVDVFPPPAPTGLQAVPGPARQAGIDLSWNPDPATSLAGYNVYLQLPNGAWARRNAALLPTPVFHDSVPAAPSAVYAVTAVDSSGNESPRSSAVIVHFQ
ncbi:MAG TPA: hypothetical protein VNL71_13120 [Chloroflexota bacterium]|nr:hypothetical protein [Chloroflexota bacterium]